MSLTFRGGAVNGLVLRFTPGPRENHPFRTHFAGIDGVSEIYGGTGARPIEAQIVLYGGLRTRDQLRELIDVNFNTTYLGANGPVVYSGKNPTFSRTYDDCTFEGFSQESGELLDVIGLLDGYWFCVGTLRWTQLSSK